MRSTPFVYGPFVYFGGAHGVPIYNLRDRYLPWTRTDPPQSIQLADVFENELGFPLCASRIKCFNLFFLWIFSAHTREYNGVLAQCRRSCAATVGEFTFSLCLFTALWLSCCLLCPLSSSHGRLLADTVEVIRNRYLPSKCVHVLPFITSIFVRQTFFYFLPADQGQKIQQLQFDANDNKHNKTGRPGGRMPGTLALPRTRRQCVVAQPSTDTSLEIAAGIFGTRLVVPARTSQTHDGLPRAWPHCVATAKPFFYAA